MLKRIFFVAITLFLSGSIAFAQTAEEIIQKALESRGNPKVFTEAKSMIISGKITQMGMDIPYKYYMKDQKKYRFETEMMGQKSSQGYDGDTLWMSMQGQVQVAPEQYVEQALQGVKQIEGLVKGPFVDYKEKGNEVELSGNVTEDGRDAYTIKFIDNEDDSEAFLYVDKNNNELFKLWQSTENKKGETMDVEVKFTDYKDINGFSVPHTIEIKQGEQGTVSFIVDKIEYGVAIEDSLFTKPSN